MTTCESCESLRAALAAAEREIQVLRSRCKVAQRNASSVAFVAKHPDANLRAMVAEMAVDFARLHEENARLMRLASELLEVVNG